MTPRPPSFIAFFEALAAIKRHTKASTETAYRTFERALMDGAVQTVGLLQGETYPRPIAAADWIRTHYERTPLPCSIEKVEVHSVSFFTWLLPEFSSDDKSGSAVTAQKEPDFVSTTSSERTGFAGRPTAKHLVLREAERRIDAREPMPKRKADFARDLIAWLATAHPDGPPLCTKSLTNNPEFTTLYRNARSAQNPSP